MEVRDYWESRFPVAGGFPIILGLVGLAVGLLVATPHKGHIKNATGPPR